MRSFILALTLVVSTNAVDLGTDTELSSELQAMANASMINEYLMAQVERINAESESDDKTVLAQVGAENTWGSFFGLW